MRWPRARPAVEIRSMHRLLSQPSDWPIPSQAYYACARVSGTASKWRYWPGAALFNVEVHARSVEFGPGSGGPVNIPGKPVAPPEATAAYLTRMTTKTNLDRIGGLICVKQAKDAGPGTLLRDW